MKGKAFYFNEKKVPKKNVKNFVTNSTGDGKYKITLELKDGTFDEEIFKYPIRQKRRMTGIHDNYPELFIVRAKLDKRMARIAERNRKKMTIFFGDNYHMIDNLKLIGTVHAGENVFVKVKPINGNDTTESVRDKEEADKRISELLDRIGRDKFILFSNSYVLKSQVEVFFKQRTTSQFGVFIKFNDATSICELFDNREESEMKYDKIMATVNPSDLIFFNNCHVVKRNIKSFGRRKSGSSSVMSMKFSGNYQLCEFLTDTNAVEKRIQEIYLEIDKPYC